MEGSLLTFEAVTTELSGLSTEDLARRAVREAVDYRPGDHGRMALLIGAELAKRLLVLETEAKACRQLTEQVARCWTSSELRADNANPDVDDATQTLDHLIGRARKATGIQAPTIEAEEIA